MDERAFVERALNLLARDFLISTEVNGFWPDGHSVFADLLCKPKCHLVESGFTPRLFLVEVKSPESQESVKKLLDAVLQSYTYTLCNFDGEEPDFVLLYPEVVTFFEWDRTHKYSGQPENAYVTREVSIVRRLMQRANVGELCELPDKYEFRFGGSYFFNPDKGQTRVKNLGMVRRIGSKKVVA